MGREGAGSPPLKLGPQNYFPGAGADKFFLFTDTSLAKFS